MSSRASTSSPEAILKRFSLGGTVEMVRWRDGKRLENEVGPKAVAARILCKRHNEALSNLDQVGLRFFMRLEEMMRRAAGHDAEAIAPLFTGFDVERFLLKTIAGHVASGMGAPKALVPAWWCSLLWGQALLNGTNGLYLFVGKPDHEVGVHVAPRRDSTGALIGGWVRLFGIELLLESGLRSGAAGNLKSQLIQGCGLYTDHRASSIPHSLARRDWRLNRLHPRAGSNARQSDVFDIEANAQPLLARPEVQFGEQFAVLGDRVNVRGSVQLALRQR